MFGDLDWPINASRRFVSVSWASCLFKRERKRARNETKKLRSFLWQWQEEPCDGKKWLPGHVPGAIDSNPSDRSVIDSNISASRSSARVIIGVYRSMHTYSPLSHTVGDHCRLYVTYDRCADCDHMNYDPLQQCTADNLRRPESLHGMIAVDVQLN